MRNMEKALKKFENLMDGALSGKGGNKKNATPANRTSVPGGKDTNETFANHTSGEDKNATPANQTSIPGGRHKNETLANHTSGVGGEDRNATLANQTSIP